MTRIAVPSPISCGIFLSYKCNCQCRYCMYACSPHWNSVRMKSWEMLGNLFWTAWLHKSLKCYPEVIILHSVSFLHKSYEANANGRGDGFGTELYGLETIFQERNASGKWLASLIIVIGGDGGGPISLSPKDTAHSQTARGLGSGVQIDNTYV